MSTCVITFPLTNSNQPFLDTNICTCIQRDARTFLKISCSISENFFLRTLPNQIIINLWRLDIAHICCLSHPSLAYLASFPLLWISFFPFLTPVSLSLPLHCRLILFCYFFYFLLFHIFLTFVFFFSISSCLSSSSVLLIPPFTFALKCLYLFFHLYLISFFPFLLSLPNYLPTSLLHKLRQLFYIFLWFASTFASQLSIVYLASAFIFFYWNLTRHEKENICRRTHSAW